MVPKVSQKLFNNTEPKNVQSCFSALPQCVPNVFSQLECMWKWAKVWSFSMLSFKCFFGSTGIHWWNFWYCLKSECGYFLYKFSFYLVRGIDLKLYSSVLWVNGGRIGYSKDLSMIFCFWQRNLENKKVTLIIFALYCTLKKSLHLLRLELFQGSRTYYEENPCMLSRSEGGSSRSTKRWQKVSNKKVIKMVKVKIVLLLRVILRGR